MFEALALENQFPPLLIENDASTIFVVKFYGFLNKLQLIYNIVPISQATGFYLSKYKKFNILIGINLFQCTNGGYILSINICDGVMDCPNDISDEEKCSCYKQNHTKNASVICKITYFGKMKKVCSNLYHMTTKGTCQPYKNITFLKSNHSAVSEAVVETEKFICNNGKTVDMMLFDDLVFDCGPNSEDEPVLLSILKHDIHLSCSHPHSIPCKEGHSKCYEMRDICVYKLNLHGHLIPCQNGGHLQNCYKFECNMMFKCISSYCVPWSFVCDGKWDCPEGDDELNNPQCIEGQICIYMYKCRSSNQTCLHIGNVCDESAECPLGDDELYCELKDVLCPVNCNCLLTDF